MLRSLAHLINYDGSKAGHFSIQAHQKSMSTNRHEDRLMILNPGMLNSVDIYVNDDGEIVLEYTKERYHREKYVIGNVDKTVYGEG